MAQAGAIPNKTQSAAILARLKTGKTITAGEALRLFGCARLASRIYDLKVSGHNIQSKMVTVATRAGTARVAQYSLGENNVD